MELKPLYSVRFRYPQAWDVEPHRSRRQRRTDFTVIFDYQRAYPKGRQQVVGAAWHLSDHDEYRWLNDSICVIAGEVRAPAKPADQIAQGDIELVFDVSELIWEAPKD
jgi:hypothetical protein